MFIKHSTLSDMPCFQNIIVIYRLYFFCFFPDSATFPQLCNKHAPEWKTDSMQNTKHEKKKTIPVKLIFKHEEKKTL